MRHARALIRDAFLQALKTKRADGTYPTSAEDRVFKSRIAPLDVNDDDELPAILIYARDESRDPWKDYGIDAEDSSVEAELRIVVEAIVRGGETVDDKLDEIAFEIEAIFDEYEVPGFEGSEVRLGDSDIDVVDGLKKPVGGIGLIYHVRYSRVWRPQPEGTRPDTVDVVTDDSGLPERIITHDKGVYQEAPIKVPPSPRWDYALVKPTPRFRG